MRGCWEEEEEEEEGGGEVPLFVSVFSERNNERASSRIAEFHLELFFLFFRFIYFFVWSNELSGCVLPAVCSMETKSLFSLHRALAQPVKMCMFDFPVTILDDLVSSDTIVCVSVCVCVCVCLHVQTDCVCMAAGALLYVSVYAYSVFVAKCALLPANIYLNVIACMCVCVCVFVCAWVHISICECVYV